MNLASYFLNGLKGTLRFKNGRNLSYKGPWMQVYPDTVIDEWYVGDFMSAEYTISVDYDTFNKEIIKCLVVAAPGNAQITVYGRSNLIENLIDITATINNSKVTILASPTTSNDGSTIYSGSKLIFSANYYYTQNELVI